MNKAVYKYTVTMTPHHRRKDSVWILIQGGGKNRYIDRVIEQCYHKREDCQHNSC